MRLGSGREAEDVGVSEVRGTVLLRSGTRHGRATGRDVLAPRIGRGAIRGGSRVVPHGDTVRTGRCRIHVIAEELRNEVVLARPSRVTGGAAMHFGERACRRGTGCGRLHEHTYQRTWGPRRRLVGRGERVVD